MQVMPNRLNRRQFTQTLALVGTGLAANLAGRAQVPARLGLKLGFDNFSLRALGLKAGGLLDYAAAQKLDSLYITTLDALESFEEKYLREVRAKAADASIDLLLGSWSICPSSRAFNKKWGTAEEHLALGIRTAEALGSRVLRVVLGTREDRQTEGGIEARIEDTVRVCKTARSQALDAGVRISIENHAGDMQAWELVTLIEAAGRDYVGATFDSGNSTWTLEDPLSSLEVLAPYIASTHIRDSMIWEYADGAKVQWTAIGEGCVESKALFEKLAQLCPGIAVHIETISGFAVDFPYLKPGFWDVWPKARGADFARFLALAKRGKPLMPHRSPDNQAEQEYQKAELERSLRYCKEIVGLGLK
jgi:3-oxoisoapionate decarboxylase